MIYSQKRPFLKTRHSENFSRIVMLIGYARVSTVDQSPEMQINALRAAGCEKIFTETASGGKVERPELQKAKSFLRDGDQLVVWKLDRLARSITQLIETVKELESRNIEFRSLTENIDTSSPGGRLVFHIFSAMAEFERDLIRERTLAGLANARKKGRRGGRPKAMDRASVVQAEALFQQGELSSKAIAERMGVSVATLYRYVPAGIVKKEV